MTEFIHQDRLRLIAVASAQYPLSPPPRPRLALHWALEPASGRPAAQWVVAARLEGTALTSEVAAP